MAFSVQAVLRRGAAPRFAALSPLPCLRFIGTRPERPAASECIGMDIGGSLAKVVVFEPNANSSELVHRVAERMKSGRHPGYEGDLAFEADDGVYSFLKFETRWMIDFLDVLKSLDFPPISISATGGGAFKVGCNSTCRLPAFAL